MQLGMSALGQKRTLMGFGPLAERFGL